MGFAARYSSSAFVGMMPHRFWAVAENRHEAMRVEKTKNRLINRILSKEYLFGHVSYYIFIYIPRLYTMAFYIFITVTNIKNAFSLGSKDKSS